MAAPRLLTVKVTDPPGWPLLAVLLGLGVAYVASWWLTFARRGTLLEARAFERLADVQQHDRARGDVDRDGHAEFSILDRAEQIIGTGDPPESSSVRGLVASGDIDGAERALAKVQTLAESFGLFVGQARRLTGGTSRRCRCSRAIRRRRSSTTPTGSCSTATDPSS